MGTGGVVSSPVNTTVHVLVFPLPSFAVTVTVCVVPSPELNIAPKTGFWVQLNVVEQLSVALAPSVRLGTINLQEEFRAIV